MFLYKPIGEMAEEVYGEIDPISASISQIKPGTIAAAPGVDVDLMKSLDKDPLEVVVEIPAAKSKRGWNYKPESLQDIVNYVNENTLSGFLGHQKPENLSNEFKTPVTHWVGAEMKDNKAYFRGIVDAAAPDLKRWIRTKRVKEVSIFGYPKIKRDAAGVNVVGYKPLSIDWTPLHRPGMPTSIVGMEMDNLDAKGEQLDGTFEQLKQELKESVKNALNTKDGQDYVGIKNIRYDNNTVIVEHEQKDQPTRLYSIPFSIEKDNKIALGDKTEVTEKRVYEPVTSGEMDDKGGIEIMDFKEIMTNLNGLLQTGKVTYSQVFGQMGLTKDKIAGEMEDIKHAVDAEDTLGKIKENLKIKGEMDIVDITRKENETLEKVKEALGVTGEMDVVDAAKKAHESVENSKKAEFQKTVDDVVKEKVAGEMAQNLVKKMLKVEDGAAKEVISGEIDNILKDDFVKNFISSEHIDMSPGINGITDNRGTESSGSLKTRRVSI